MAKVPDLGSDFAQKLLRDLRRRRERLGFDSAAAAPRARGKLSSFLADRVAGARFQVSTGIALSSFFFPFPGKQK